MFQIKFSKYDFKLKKEKGKEFIYDIIRKQWLLLTPEEWVRQNIVHHLCFDKQYPTSLIAIEKEIFFNGLKKRFDILVYDKNHSPWMLIECKSQQIKLSEKVLQQALLYHNTVQVKYIAITNGNATVVVEKMNDELKELEEFPMM